MTVPLLFFLQGLQLCLVDDCVLPVRYDAVHLVSDQFRPGSAECIKLALLTPNQMCLLLSIDWLTDVCEHVEPVGLVLREGEYSGPKEADTFKGCLLSLKEVNLM